ncbi:MAG: universal stress protein [Methyloprofundus sp.]|nr:universal stress protein [Methyloprofundus sp.]MDT8424399.1 universal stress protein [Methyloprofundus sp.]
MSHLPKQLYWAIENPEEREIEALYWRKVRSLARLFSTSVTLLNASDAPKIFEGLRLSKAQAKELHEPQNKKIQKQLDALLPLLTEKYPLSASYKIITERPFFEAVISTIKQQENTWLVLQNSKKTGISNIVWQFIRACPQPIYLAKQKDWRSPLNILAAIDPTHENDENALLDHKVLATAKAIADSCSANLHVIHCYTPVIMANNAIQKRIELLYRENFYETIEPYNIDQDKTYLLAGDPSRKIEQLCASLEVDLIVMGAVSRNSLQRIFIGNTVEEVIPTVESDILLVKALSKGRKK